MTAHLVLLGGVAGAGKSTLAEELRGRGHLVLGKDALTRHVTEELLRAHGQPITDRESDIYLTKVRPNEYRVLEHVALSLTAVGQSPIVEAPWGKELTSEKWTTWFRQRTVNVGGTLTCVWITCDPAINHARLADRGAPRDHGKLADWDTYLKAASPLMRTTPSGADITVDSSAASPSELADMLLEQLAGRAEQPPEKPARLKRT